MAAQAHTSEQYGARKRVPDRRPPSCKQWGFSMGIWMEIHDEASRQLKTNDVE
jgi:hypothetical protein